MSDKLRAALHGARYLPAAAIPEGAVVRAKGRASDGTVHAVDVTVLRVHNADPVPGRIRWETKELGDVRLGGADVVEVISLP